MRTPAGTWNSPAAAAKSRWSAPDAPAGAAAVRAPAGPPELPAWAVGAAWAHPPQASDPAVSAATTTALARPAGCRPRPVSRLCLVRSLSLV